MIFRRIGYTAVLSVQQSRVLLPVGDTSIRLHVSENDTIEDLYKSLNAYKDVKIESLENILIGRSTKIQELHGGSFVIKIANSSFKIIQSNFHTTMDKYSFLFSIQSDQSEKKHLIHKYLTKYEKVFNSKDSLTKLELAEIFNGMIAKNNYSTYFSNEELKERIDSCYKKIEILRPTYENLSKTANFFSLTYLWGGFGVTVLQMMYIGSGTFYFYSWDIMEAQAYLIGLGNLIIGLWTSWRHGIVFTHKSIYDSMYQNHLIKGAKKVGFDLEKYKSLILELESLQKKITL